MSEIKPFLRSQVQRAEHDYNIHAVKAPEGFGPDDALSPGVWVLVAENEQMKVGDEIRVTADDMSWIQRLVITFRKGTILHVARESLSELKVSTPKAAARPALVTGADRYIVKHHGGGRWGVFDNLGSTEEAQWMERGLESKEAAEEALSRLLTPA